MLFLKPEAPVVYGAQASPLGWLLWCQRKEHIKKAVLPGTYNTATIPYVSPPSYEDPPHQKQHAMRKG